MKEIRILPCIENATLQTVRSLLGIHDESKYGWKFILDDNNPDYLIINELMYYREEAYRYVVKQMKKYPDAIRIYRAGECYSPDFNMFDYAVVFDRKLQNGDRVCRVPFNRYFGASLLVQQSEIDYASKISGGGCKFCNFMYSNANAHPNRDRLFYVISEYKRVDAIGSHLNNTGVRSTRYDSDWRRGSIELRKPYKFSIASENASFDGYVSEKLISCLQAGTVAIYWGDPTVGEDFNTKSFINCHEYKDFGAVVERIREIDQDDDLWLKIATTPWQTDEQIARMKADDETYIRFLSNIFNCDVESSKRRPEGTHPGYYEKWFENRAKFSIVQTLKGTVRKIVKR